MGKSITTAIVREALQKVVHDVQEASGRLAPVLSDTFCPVGGAEGFDSLAAVEAAVMLEAQLGFDLPVETVFLSDDGGRALSVSEITARIVSIAGGRS
jgi:hypothetical protein